MDTDKRKVRGVIAISVVLIAVCGYLFYYTFSFQSPFGALGSDYGPAFFPRIMLGVIAVSAVGLIVQAMLRKRPAGSSDGLALRGSQLMRVGALWVVSLGFYYAWRHFDFLYVSILFTIVIALVLGVRRLLTLAMLGTVGPILYLVFRQVLRVSL